MEKEEIIKRRDELRDKLEKEDKKAKIGKIVYYDKFEVINATKNHYAFTEANIFVVTREVKKNGNEIKLYDVYDSNFNHISSTNERGEIIYTQEYLHDLKEKSRGFYALIGVEERK